MGALVEIRRGSGRGDIRGWEVRREGVKDRRGCSRKWEGQGWDEAGMRLNSHYVFCSRDGEMLVVTKNPQADRPKPPSKMGQNL